MCNVVGAGMRVEGLGSIAIILGFRVWGFRGLPRPPKYPS